jgi:hypothetical protein
LLKASRRDEAQRANLFGIERAPNRFFLGLVRVVLAGIDHPYLELDDALGTWGLAIALRGRRSNSIEAPNRDR